MENKKKQSEKEVEGLINDCQAVIDSLLKCKNENCNECEEDDCFHFMRQVLAYLLKDKIDFIRANSGGFIDSYFKEKRKEFDDRANYFQ